jgi:hypothetical protein
MLGPDYRDLVFCPPDGRYYGPDRVGATVKELMGETAGLK